MSQSHLAKAQLVVENTGFREAQSNLRNDWMILYDYSQLNSSVLLISVKCSLIIDYVKSKAGAGKKGAFSITS